MKKNLVILLAVVTYLYVTTTCATMLEPETGDYYHDQHIADLTEKIRLDPNSWLGYALRGNAYKSKGDYDQAIADYTEAIRLDPNWAYAYNKRGFAYERKGNYKQAIKDYETALRLAPNSINYKESLENALRQQKR